MNAYEVSAARGGEVLRFDYNYADLAGTVEYNYLDWGDYDQSNIIVGDVIHPDVDDTGEALAGWYRVSVPFFQYAQLTSAYVEIEGLNFTAEYTRNGTSWTALTSAFVVDEADDFDIRVNFAAGVEDAYVNNIKVILLNSDTLLADQGTRKLNFSADPIVDGAIDLDSLSAVTNDSGVITGTVEMWINPDTTTPFQPNANQTVVNLLTPAQATATSGVASGSGGVTSTSSVDTTWSVHGGSSARVTENTGGNGSTGDIRWTAVNGSLATKVPVTPGETIYAEGTINAGTSVGKSVRMYVEVFTSAGAYITSLAFGGSAVTLSGIHTIRGSVTIPATAAYAHILVQVSQPADNSYFMVDAFGMYRGGLPTAWEPRHTGTTYVNGVAAALTTGSRKHVVFVYDYPVDTQFLVGPGVIDHLAFYPQAMTSGEVAALYAAQNPTPIRINDTSVITVTEAVPTVDIYAYTWTQSGT